MIVLPSFTRGQVGWFPLQCGRASLAIERGVAHLAIELVEPLLGRYEEGAETILLPHLQVARSHEELYKPLASLVTLGSCSRYVASAPPLVAVTHQIREVLHMTECTALV